MFYEKGRHDASIIFGRAMAMGLDKDEQKRFVELIDSARKRLKQDNRIAIRKMRKESK